MSGEGRESSPTFDIQVEISRIAEFFHLALDRKNRVMLAPHIIFFLKQMKSSTPAEYSGETDDLNIRFRFRQPVWDLIVKVLNRIVSRERSQEEAAEHILAWLSFVEKQRELMACRNSLEAQIEALRHKMGTGVTLRVELMMEIYSDLNLGFICNQNGAQAAELLDKFFDAIRVEGLELFKKIEEDFKQDRIARSSLKAS